MAVVNATVDANKVLVYTLIMVCLCYAYFIIIMYT